MSRLQWPIELARLVFYEQVQLYHVLPVSFTWKFLAQSIRTIHIRITSRLISIITTRGIAEYRSDPPSLIAQEQRIDYLSE